MNQDLFNAVVEQFGGEDEFESAYQDVVNHGIDGGFSGFIYYVETVKFFRDNFDLIQEWFLDAVSNELVSIPKLIEEFGVREYHATMANNENLCDQLANKIVWMVAEEACFERDCR